MKLLRRLLVHSDVRPSMTGGFMASLSNFSNQLRVPFGYQSKDEEGGSGALFIEEFQQPVHIVLYAARNFRPVRPVDHLRQCFDMEVILDVNRQGV